MRQKCRALLPEHVKGEDPKDDGIDLADASEAVARSNELLQKLGRPGFTSVDQMLKDFVAACYLREDI